MDRMLLLEAYVRLVEVESFSQVARDLRVGQSTVSKWIAALEEEVGVPLLQRTTRSQRVTDAGQRFYERARSILDQYAEAIDDLRQRAPQVRGRLRVSVPAVFGHRHILPHLPAFLDAHPELEVELRFSDRYVNLVEEGVDVAVRVGLPVASSLTGRRLGGTARRLVAAPALPALAHPSELAERPCLLHTGLSGAVWTFQRGEAQVRVPVRGRVAADSSEALLAPAVAGHGAALLADWLVAEDVAAGRLAVLLPDWSLPPAPIRAVTPPGRYVPPRVRVFLAHLQQQWGPELGVGAGEA